MVVVEHHYHQHYLMDCYCGYRSCILSVMLPSSLLPTRALHVTWILRKTLFYPPSSSSYKTRQYTHTHTHTENVVILMGLESDFKTNSYQTAEAITLFSWKNSIITTLKALYNNDVYPLSGRLIWAHSCGIKAKITSFVVNICVF